MRGRRKTQRRSRQRDLRRQVLLNNASQHQAPNLPSAGETNTISETPKPPKEQPALQVYLLHYLMLLITYGEKYEAASLLTISFEDIQPTLRILPEKFNASASSCPDSVFLRFTLSALLDNKRDFDKFKLELQRKKGRESLTNPDDYFNPSPEQPEKCKQIKRILNKNTLPLQHLFCDSYATLGSPLILDISSWDKLLQAGMLTDFFKAIVVNNDNENDTDDVRLTTLKLKESPRTIYFLKLGETCYQFAWEEIPGQQHQFLNWRQYYSDDCKRQTAQKHLNDAIKTLIPPESDDLSPSAG